MSYACKLEDADEWERLRNEATQSARSDLRVHLEAAEVLWLINRIEALEDLAKGYHEDMGGDDDKFDAWLEAAISEWITCPTHLRRAR